MIWKNFAALVSLRFSTLLILLIVLVANHLSADLSSRVSSLVKSTNSYQKGVYVSNLTDNKKIYEYNSTAQLKPASVLKIAITTYLLDKLGGDFRFSTYLEASERNGSKVKDLIIRGRGDPAFTTEDLWILLRQLKKYGIKEVGNLYLDDTAFINPEERSGQSAYQAGVSALALNFNSVTFKICPGANGQAASVSWDPWEYPLDLTGSISSGRGSSYAVDDITKSGDSRQRFRLSGSISSGAACQDVYRTITNPASYLANTAYNFLNYLGIKVTGKLYREKYSGAVRTLAEHESKPLADILADLNKFSSNFIAQQLLYRAGEVNNRFDRKLGLTQIKNYLVRLGGSKEIVLADASGLSHDNRISARDLMKVVYKAYRDPKIWAEFLASLAVDRQTGTLRKRKYQSGITLRGKTGTINGVDTLMGIVRSKSGKDYAFVLLHNQVSNAARSRDLENKLVDLLYYSG